MPGIHPRTITWRRAGDARVLIAAGYALLLQVSHPTVGAGVSEHSQFQRDPWGRLLRALGAGLRTVTPLMPRSLRNTGPGYLRWRREAIARGDVASGTLEPSA
jgi:uncharacterized protein (DUF2236 family)